MPVFLLVDTPEIHHSVKYVVEQREVSPYLFFGNSQEAIKYMGKKWGVFHIHRFTDGMFVI